MHLCQGPENSMKTVNSLPPPEDCNCFAVRAAARRVSQCYDRFLAPTDLRTTQYSILARLKRKGPLTINAAVSDRRAKELRLTKAGENRLQEAFEGWSQAQARFEATFGEKRAADLRELLRTAAASEFAPGTTNR